MKKPPPRGAGRGDELMLEKGKDRRPVVEEQTGSNRNEQAGKRSRNNREHSVGFTLLPVPFFIGNIFGSFIGTILVKILTQSL